MAAVTNNIESHYERGVARSDVVVDAGSLNGLGAAAVNQASLAKSHTMLTKFVWFRSMLERELQQQSYKLVKEAGLYRFVLTPGLRKEAVPWQRFAAERYTKVLLWGTDNAKMQCPTFAIPAGGVMVGGTCPGADAGQTVTPVNARVARLEGAADGWRLRTEAPGTGVKPLVKEGLAVCQSCYATEGSFSRSSVQTDELVRFWWIRSQLQAKNDALLEQVFVDSILSLPFKHDRHGIKAIRLHDSGDFFSQRYAEVWLRVADVLAERMPEVVIWAPTRTWAQGGWTEFWQQRLPRLRSVQLGRRPNLMVRPSAYNFGDAAPESMAQGNSRGSTSLYAVHARVPEELKNRTDATKVGLTRGLEPRADFNCQVYGAETASCTASLAPDGKRGCRACWVHPELRINYSAH